eukprot:scaffold123117_cov18-Tisochrysis_lutea.AAC.2
MYACTWTCCNKASLHVLDLYFSIAGATNSGGQSSTFEPSWAQNEPAYDFFVVSSCSNDDDGVIASENSVTACMYIHPAYAVLKELYKVDQEACTQEKLNSLC